MRLHRFLAALLLGLPMATPIPVAAEDAPLAPEVQRRVAVVVLAHRIRDYAAIAPAPVRRFLPVATASDRSGLGLNRSSPRGEDIWASISIPVPIAMPTAARSAVWA